MVDLDLPPSPAPNTQFYNLRAAGLWGILAALGVALFVTRYRGMIGLAGAAEALFALQAAISLCAGVAVTSGGVTLPRAPIRQAPLIVWGRQSIPMAGVRDVTFAGHSLGFDVVVLADADKNTPTLFSSREKRLAFFEALRRAHPEVRIYRAV